MTNSRAQDAAAAIVKAQREVEAADAAYRRGGSLNNLNAANRALADAHNDLYTVDAGVIPDRR